MRLATKLAHPVGITGLKETASCYWPVRSATKILTLENITVNFLPSMCVVQRKYKRLKT